MASYDEYKRYHEELKSVNFSELSTMIQNTERVNKGYNNMDDAIKGMSSWQSGVQNTLSKKIAVLSNAMQALNADISVNVQSTINEGKILISILEEMKSNQGKLGTASSNLSQEKGKEAPNTDLISRYESDKRKYQSTIDNLAGEANRIIKEINGIEFAMNIDGILSGKEVYSGQRGTILGTNAPNIAVSVDVEVAVSTPTPTPASTPTPTDQTVPGTTSTVSKPIATSTNPFASPILKYNGGYYVMFQNNESWNKTKYDDTIDGPTVGEDSCGAFSLINLALNDKVVGDSVRNDVETYLSSGTSTLFSEQLPAEYNIKDESILGVAVLANRDSVGDPNKFIEKLNIEYGKELGGKFVKKAMKTDEKIASAALLEGHAVRTVASKGSGIANIGHYVDFEGFYDKATNSKIIVNNNGELALSDGKAIIYNGQTIKATEQTSGGNSRITPTVSEYLNKNANVRIIDSYCRTEEQLASMNYGHIKDLSQDGNNPVTMIGPGLLEAPAECINLSNKGPGTYTWIDFQPNN